MDLRTIGLFLLWSIDHFLLGYLCPTGSVHYQDYCYFMSDISANFSTARRECGRFPGGDLATFHTQEEFQFLWDLKGSGAPWIGLERQHGSTRAFIDGSLLNTPSHGFDNGPDEDCATIGSNILALFDNRCNLLRRYICQFQSLFDSISVEMPHGTTETDQLVDGDTNTCLHLPTGCSSFAKITLKMTSATNGTVQLGIVSGTLPCRDPNVMVMWRNQQGNFAKCAMITMETTGSDGYYRCQYECVAMETKMIVVNQRMMICELEN